MNNGRKPFAHRHAAHCESGVMSLLLSHHGLEISEAMVFGLSGALSFAYIPFVKLSGLPLIAYRGRPRAIIKGISKNLGIKMHLQTFARPESGRQALDELLDRGQIAGLQTSVFWLPYFPEDMRFHFNAHNLIAYARQDDEYLLSDPVFEETARCPVADLNKARFVKGLLAPKGLLYYPIALPQEIDHKRILPPVMRATAKTMLKTPVPIAGIRGMRFLAKAIARQAGREPHKARLFLGHIIRMQEEIGTGGAGFRFIYAAFLQEAGQKLGDDNLLECSQMMTAVGDQWREFAWLIAKMIRRKQNIDFGVLEDKLKAVAASEARVYQHIIKVSR